MDVERCFALWGTFGDAYRLKLAALLWWGTPAVISFASAYHDDDAPRRSA